MRIVLALAGAALVLASAAAAHQPQLPGDWTLLRPAPFAPLAAYERAAVWTGKELVVFGRAGRPGEMHNVAYSYSLRTGRWSRLSPPAGPTGSYQGYYGAVWTGTRMLVWGPFTQLSYEPAANRWTQLPVGGLGGEPLGLVVWTGREMIGWGGGCCDEQLKVGFAFDPATRTWRKLPPAPIEGRQGPVGVWTGHELVILPTATKRERQGGAAYDPATNRWRTIPDAPLPRVGGNAIWDGRDVLLVGGARPGHGDRGVPASAPLAFNPVTNRWRRLAAMDEGAYGRLYSAAVWTGRLLYLWGGETMHAGREVLAPHGLAYDPKSNRWSELVPAPVVGRIDPVVAWTGKALLVWGGDPLDDSLPGESGPDSGPFLDGALYEPY